FNLALTSMRRDRQFRDVASLYGSPLARGSDQVFAGINTRWGNLGVGYVRQRADTGENTRLVNANWFNTLGKTANFSFGMVVDLDNRDATTFNLSFSVLLDSGLQSTTNSRYRKGSAGYSTSLMRQAPVDE